MHCAVPSHDAAASQPLPPQCRDNLACLAS
jgi:hypothetical protein